MEIFLGNVDADSSVRFLIGPHLCSCIVGECELTNGRCKLHDDAKKRPSSNERIAIIRIIL